MHRVRSSGADRRDRWRRRPPHPLRLHQQRRSTRASVFAAPRGSFSTKGRWKYPDRLLLRLEFLKIHSQPDQVAPIHDHLVRENAFCRSRHKAQVDHGPTGTTASPSARSQRRSRTLLWSVIAASHNLARFGITRCDCCSIRQFRYEG